MHFVFAGLRADSHTARTLSNLGKNNLVLGCTPVINLFQQRGDPIRVTHAAAQYPVVANSRHAYAYAVYSIDAVKLVKQTPQGEFISEVKPFYSLRHGATAEKNGRYWIMRRDEMVGLKSPGYEAEITMVDTDFNPTRPETDTLSLELTCTNRDLPSQLSYSMPGGDLFLEGGALVKQIVFLRKPTVSYGFGRGKGAHWRLISHLSLNHLSLGQKGIEILQETFRLYDLPRSAINEKILSGIAQIDHQSASHWLPGKPFPSLARGVAITLTIDESNFVGSGLHVFSNLLDRFFALHVHINSFTQFNLKSKKNRGGPAEMSATQRQRQSSVATRLLDAPYRFDFFQAVRVLELWLKTQGKGGPQAVAAHVRFENSIALSFPPSDIESLRASIPRDTDCADVDAADADADAVANGDTLAIERFYLTPSFMGFLGPNGTLPRHYSERLVAHQIYQRDNGPRAFLDTYSNRAVALFYAAWKKHRLELDFESKGRDGFLPLLMSLGGLGYVSRRERLNFESEGVHDESLAYYTAALRQRPMSAVYLQAVLNEHFGVGILITQFIGKWYALPHAHQSRLGQANAVLGSTALCGHRVWQRDLRIALQIGPLRKKDFDNFLPQQTAARALEQMLKILVGVTLEFEIQLILHADDIEGCDLRTVRSSGRLGLDTFVATQKVQQNRGDVRYTMNAL